MIKLATLKRDAHPSDPRWVPLRRDVLYFALISAIVWLALYGVFAAFPFVRNGADALGAAKVGYLTSHSIFSQEARVRLLVFGDSKVLAGFNPTIYDAALGRGVESFNAGRPSDGRVIDLLKRVLTRGERPTHVLLQLLTEEEGEPEWRDYLAHDKLLIDLLFPFRTFPRDLALFLISSRQQGGIVNAYRENKEAVAGVIDDRGYYFIKGQSHYPNDRLPDEYRLPIDQPMLPWRWTIDPDAPQFKELAGLAAAYGFKVIFIPRPLRVGEFAPPEPTVFDAKAQPLPSTPGFYVAGPSAWLFEPRYFSDPVHFNKEGAALYSNRLAEVTAPIVNGKD
ncbi:hypothetical protein [Methylocapsa acidiphila]|uniref:hypothetical protein n=1 Tax=Methylocapsa acidiphila TaxID=133552 RepID=UPI00047AA12E|nr:hypothetical protein [Methylocapsa acidiphila]